MPRELKPCGTKAAYTRHVRRGEKIDTACRRAMRSESTDRKRTPYRRARQMALRALTARHLDEYRFLLGQALKEIEADPSLLKNNSPRRPRGRGGAAPGTLGRAILAWMDQQPAPVKLKVITDHFADQAIPGTVSVAVQRLATRGKIERIAHGFYWSAAG